MTTPTPRWTADVEDRLVEYLERIASSGGWRVRDAAREYLTSLADAGVLTPVGGETRQEIEVQTTGLRYPCNDMPMAWREFGELKAKGYDAQIVQRDVWIGPWREVTDDPA